MITRRINPVRPAFTLVELLASMAIIALLVGLLIPALSHSIGAARAFRCQMSLRSAAFDFSIFADEQLHGDRGDDKNLPSGKFYLETFQESQYRIDEFWAYGLAPTHTLPDAGGNDPLRCPEVDGDLVVRRNTPCSAGAVSPPESVSFGFNARLHRPETKINGMPVARKTALSSSLLEHASVPLLWDVDGAMAKRKGVQPVFSAPAMDSEQVYAGDSHWFPSFRHGSGLQVAFVGGHVAASKRPLEETGWMWGSQPAR